MQYNFDEMLIGNHLPIGIQNVSPIRIRPVVLDCCMHRVQTMDGI